MHTVITLLENCAILTHSLLRHLRTLEQKQAAFPQHRGPHTGEWEACVCLKTKYMQVCITFGRDHDDARSIAAAHAQCSDRASLMTAEDFPVYVLVRCAEGFTVDPVFVHRIRLSIWIGSGFGHSSWSAECVHAGDDDTVVSPSRTSGGSSSGLIYTR